ncbi:hypothetical protein SS50377_28259 [Spironucleus salmonicida]|uniref:Transmembrane protein n=1 Tax=Spironucleus salmonicida TaxID=348837 RepID=A0A9P8LL00_9EUKA|nr:hypothetical protein SS50377_28259 [Spironucleus salmonicida]
MTNLTDLEFQINFIDSMHSQLVNSMIPHLISNISLINNDSLFEQIDIIQKDINMMKAHYDSLYQQHESFKFQLQTAIHHQQSNCSSPVQERSLMNSNASFQDQQTEILEFKINQDNLHTKNLNLKSLIQKFQIILIISFLVLIFVLLI